jgi:hypothetical protein
VFPEEAVRHISSENVAHRLRKDERARGRGRQASRAVSLITNEA